MNSCSAPSANASAITGTADTPAGDTAKPPSGKFPDSEYIRFDPFEGDRDIRIECRTVKIVTTRKEHRCHSLSLDGMHDMPPGTRARYEHALVEGAWGSYYTCIECMDKWLIDFCGRRPIHADCEASKYGCLNREHGRVNCMDDCDMLRGHEATKPVLPETDRLVACWNACEGISDPEKYIEHARTICDDVPKVVARLEDAERQRDAAVECLKYARRMMKPDSDTAYVDQVIATLEKGKP